MDEMIYKTFVYERKAVDPEQGIYELMPSAESSDRDSDILLAAGAQLDNFRKNPVVLYAHDYGGTPVAKATSIEAVPGMGLKSTIQFPQKGLSPFADEIHGLWAGMFLNAASVGFIPNKSEPRPGPNGEMPQKGEDYYWPYGKIYTSWELLEFSIVPVPANADALRLGIGGVGRKSGRVLSAANEKSLRGASDAILAVLAQLDAAPEEPKQYGELSAVLADLRKAFLGG